MGEAITLLRQLTDKYAEITDPIYGKCLVIPTNEYGAAWDQKLKEEGCKIFQGSAGGKTAFFVRLPGQDRVPAPEPRTVYEMPQKPDPPTPKPPARRGPAPGKRVGYGLTWTQDEDRELIKLVTLGLSDEAISEKIPGRTATAVKLRKKRLKKHGLLQTKRGRPRKTIAPEPPRTSEPTAPQRPTPIPTAIPTAIPTPAREPITLPKRPFDVKTNLQVNVSVDCSDPEAVNRFRTLVKEVALLTLKET